MTEKYLESVDDGSDFIKQRTPTYQFIERELVPLVKGICSNLGVDGGWDLPLHPQYKNDLNGGRDLVRIWRALKRIKEKV